MVTEYQVDNYAKVGTVNTKLTQSHIDQIVAGTLTVTPIALTETWILDLHFIKALDDVSKRFIYSQSDVNIKYQQVRAIADIYFNNEYQDSTDCVHQLQNINQAITGIMIVK